MKVRWSSTYVMLSCAESRRQVRTSFCVYILGHNLLTSTVLHQAVDEFILRLGVNADKQRKISALALHDEEWTHICLFCNILQVCVYSVHIQRLLIVDAPLTGDSMQTMPNRHSLQHRHQPYRTCSLPWRNYMHHGRRPLQRPTTSLSFQRSLLAWRSSTLITSAVQSQTRTLWPW